MTADSPNFSRSFDGRIEICGETETKDEFSSNCSLPIGTWRAETYIYELELLDYFDSRDRRFEMHWKFTSNKQSHWQPITWQPVRQSKYGHRDVTKKRTRMHPVTRSYLEQTQELATEPSPRDSRPYSGISQQKSAVLSGWATFPPLPQPLRAGACPRDSTGSRARVSRSHGTLVSGSSRPQPF